MARDAGARRVLEEMHEARSQPSQQNQQQPSGQGIIERRGRLESAAAIPVGKKQRKKNAARQGRRDPCRREALAQLFLGWPGTGRLSLESGFWAKEGR